MNRITAAIFFWLRISVVLAVVAVVCIFGAASVLAQSTAVSQSFTAGQTGIVAGSLVSVKPGTQKTVQNANADNAVNLVGIVSQDPLVALSSSNAEGVQVVISGSTTALVSDINGPIAAGDKITASPISGVGMRASDDGQVVGTAQSAFDTSKASSQTIQDKSGKDQTVRIGELSVQVNASYYVAPANKFLPPFLQNLANAVAGRQVSFIRVILASILVLGAFVSIFTLLYASIRSSIVSIGRNPLAASAIRKGLLQVSLASLLILGFTLAATYLVLSL